MVDDVQPGPRRRFRILVTGTGSSTLGNYLNMVALGLYVYQTTGSALYTGLFMALRLGAGFVAGMLGGTVAARLPRRPTMIACDLIQAAVLISLVLVPAAVGIRLLPVVAVAIGLLSTTSMVLMRSSVPDLVGHDDRVWANGLLVTARGCAMALGFAIGGVVVSWSGYHAAFLVGGATYVVSAITLATVKLPFPVRRARLEPRGPAAVDGLWRTYAWALAAVPAIAAIVAIRALDAFGSASHNVGIPIYASLEVPADPASFVGSFSAVWAVGLLVAHRLVQRRRTAGRAGADERAFLLGTWVMSAAFIVAFTGIPLPWVLIVSFVAGLADGFTEITYTSRVQAEPDPARGHFFGLTAMAENAGLGVGMLVAAALLEIWSTLAVAALLHGLVIVVVTGYLVMNVRRGREPPSGVDSAAPAPEVTTGR